MRIAGRDCGGVWRRDEPPVCFALALKCPAYPICHIAHRSSIRGACSHRQHPGEQHFPLKCTRTPSNRKLRRRLDSFCSLAWPALLWNADQRCEWRSRPVHRSRPPEGVSGELLNSRSGQRAVHRLRIWMPGGSMTAVVWCAPAYRPCQAVSVACDSLSRRSTLVAPDPKGAWLRWLENFAVDKPRW